MKFGIKEKVMAVGVGVILTGSVVATAALNLGNESPAPTSTESEVTSMEIVSEIETPTSNIDLTPIDNAVSEGIDKINSATGEALERIQSIAEIPNTLSEAPIAEASTVKTGVEKIPLNIVSDNEFCTITFTNAAIYHDDGLLYFWADTSPKIEDGYVSMNKDSFIIDQSGNKVFNNDSGSFRQMSFTGVDTQNLKSVTFTYQLTHNTDEEQKTTDPVAVVFDIPIE